MTRSPDLSDDYANLIKILKECLAAARLLAARAVNSELIALYWDIGKAIVKKQQALGWGQSVVEQIAGDLRASFPGTQRFLGAQRLGHASTVRGVLERAGSTTACRRKFP